MPNSPEILFFDDFTAPALNRRIWNVEVTGQIHNRELQAYLDSPETLLISQDEPDSRGALILQTQYRPGFITPQGDRLDFLSARIHTRGNLSFRYGRVAARLKLPALPGTWPAFWALGLAEAWPACGEIDIMEAVGESDWVSAAAHGENFFGESALVNKKYFSTPSGIAEWHTYAVECAPDVLRFFVDDELIYRITRPMVEFFGPWPFDSEKYLLLNLALGGVYPLKTNGAQAPCLGLPAASLETLQREPARFLVDWVEIRAL